MISFSLKSAPGPHFSWFMSLSGTNRLQVGSRTSFFMILEPPRPICSWFSEYFWYVFRICFPYCFFCYSMIWGCFKPLLRAESSRREHAGVPLTVIPTVAPGKRSATQDDTTETLRLPTSILFDRCWILFDGFEKVREPFSNYVLMIIPEC